jgi:hypothetical protein
MANAWVEFVKKWSKDNGETYSCAVSLPACREAYQATKPPKKAKRLTQKQERETMGAEDVASTAQRAEAKASLSKKKESINKGKTILKAKRAKKDVEKQLVETVGMMGEDRNVAEPKKVDVVDLRPRGRPKKYATAEEAKLAKATKTVEAKKKRQATKKAEKAQKKAERPNIQFQILEEAVPSTEPVAKAIAPIRRRIPEPAPDPADPEPEPEPAPATVSHQQSIFDLARKELGGENLTLLYQLLGDFDEVTDPTKLQYSLELPKGQRTSLRYADGKKYYVNNNGTQFETDNMNRIQATINSILAGSPFTINLYHQQSAMGRKAGVRFYIRDDFPPRTKTAKKLEDWKKVVADVVKPLRDNTALWTEAREIASGERESRATTKADTDLAGATAYFRSKGINIDTVPVEDTKVVLKNLLTDKKIKWKGITNVLEGTGKEVLVKIWKSIAEWKDGAFLAEFADNLRRRVNVVASVPALPAWAMGLISEYLPNAPAELKAMNPEVTLAEQRAKAKANKPIKKLEMFKGVIEDGIKYFITRNDKVYQYINGVWYEVGTEDYRGRIDLNKKKKRVPDNFRFVNRYGERDEDIPYENAPPTGGKSPCVNGKELKKGRCVRIPKKAGFFGCMRPTIHLGFEDRVANRVRVLLPNINEQDVAHLTQQVVNNLNLPQAQANALSNEQVNQLVGIVFNLLGIADNFGYIQHHDETKEEEPPAPPAPEGGAISNPEINHDWFHNYAQRINQPLINYKGLADSIAHPNIAQVRELVGKINGLIG